jgi:hypothetical protein
MIELSRYYENNRESRILSSVKGTFVVEMYQDNQLIESRSLPGYTLRYAEDCAENWVIGEIQ